MASDRHRRPIEPWAIAAQSFWRKVGVHVTRKAVTPLLPSQIRARCISRVNLGNAAQDGELC